MMKKKKSGRRTCDDDGKDISNNPNPANIGDELIVYEILSRLPVKSLMRFKCVCKNWGSLIHDDPYFADLHLSQSNTRPHLLLITAPMDNGGICLFSVDLFQGRVTVVHTQKTISLVRKLKYVNGLICFVHKKGIRVYNPSTQKATPFIKTTLPEKEGEQEEGRVINNVHHHRHQKRLFEKYGFGFDPATNEHKVICIWKIFGIQVGPVMVIDQVCEVMIVGYDNTWRRIDDVPPYRLHGGSVYVNGAIYWWGDSMLFPQSAKVIVAFDVGSEKFRVIPIPYFIPSGGTYFSLALLEMDGHIAILDRCSSEDDDNMIKMWIFNDDCASSSCSSSSNWIEETISIRFFFQSIQAIAGTDLIIIKPYKLMNPFSLYYYDRKKKTSKKIEITGMSSFTSPCHGMIVKNKPHLFQITTFVESLLPVQKQRRQQQQQYHNHLQQPPLVN